MNAAIVRWLERRWYGGVAPNALLRVLENMYARTAVQRRREFLHGAARMLRPGVPVIVVGNLTVGGAGKTPLTIALVEGLRARGFRPGVVSRGYGRRVNDLRRVSSGAAAADVGDEPLLIARRTGVPVAVAPGRYAASRLLEQSGEIDVLIADDGLQHYTLMRDIEILVIDDRRRLGNMRLLPAGPLREPLERGASCDFVVINAGTSDSALPLQTAPAPASLLPVGEGGAATPEKGVAEAATPNSSTPDITAQLAALTSRSVPMHLHTRDAIVLSTSTSTRIPLTAFAHQRVHAVAAIADPERFFTTLRAHGIDCIPHPFPDHHAFTASDFDVGDALPILMTEKDAVKCTGFATGRMHSVPVDAIVPPTFLDAIAARVRIAAAELHA